MQQFDIVVLAAGSGKRMEAGCNKMFVRTVTQNDFVFLVSVFGELRCGLSLGDVEMPGEAFDILSGDTDAWIGTAIAGAPGTVVGCGRHILFWHGNSASGRDNLFESFK